MPISFLAPLFLAGLLALAIPIIIHLTHRERKDVVAFPSLMFLRRIPYRTVRRQRIRHWLLFLMRSAAIALLVAAFARPLLDSSVQGSTVFSSARELVVLVDRSYSMGYGERWDRALDAARRVIDGVGPEDLATLVLFEERAEAVTQATADQAVLDAALGAAALSARLTRYGPALQLAREIIEGSDKPLSEVVLITDFQKAGWDAQNAVSLPKGTAFTGIDVSNADPSNLAVTGASFVRSRRAGAERVAVSARVDNLGVQSFEDVTVSLEIDGQEIQTQSVGLAPNSSTMLRFAPFNLPREPVRGVIRAGDDALPLDNSFNFLLAPERAVSVLIVNPNGAGRDHGLYLRRALGVGGRPGFDVAETSIGQLSPADLEGRSVVILDDVPFPSGATGERLRVLISEGGGLLAVLGRRTRAGAWPAEARDVLPGAYGAPIDRSSSGGGTLSFVDYDHPVFELFSAPRSGDFTPARFFRYRRMELTGEPRVLARFDDGSAALAERRLGEGRVLVWTSDMANFWNNFAVQPVFLPFVHQALKHLSGYREPVAWFQVGDVIDLTEYSRQGGARFNRQEGSDEDVERIVESPTGVRFLMPADAEPQLVLLGEPGFYQVRYLEDGDERAYSVAVNVDVAESDLRALDPEELGGAVTAEGEAEAAAVEVVLTREDRERRQNLWWYLLVGAVVLLLGETVVSNRVPRLAS